MNKRLHNVEVIVDMLIPYCVLALMTLIFTELFFYEFAHYYEGYIRIVDVVILSFFWCDLIFKYIRVRNVPKFFRTYLIDIIAVFPFFLLFRLFEGVAMLLTETFSQGQLLFHEGIEVERIGSRLLHHVFHGQKLERSYLMYRFLKPTLRLPRLLKVIPYFEKPTGHHHKHEFLRFDYFRHHKLGNNTSHG